MREYFSHDYNARNDRKIAALVREYKSAGYGIFWSTCEMMHEEGDKLEYEDITFEAIADDLKEKPEFIKEVLDKCISKFKLFTRDNNVLSSNRVKKNLNKRECEKNIKAESGRKGGIKSGESRRNENKSKQNEAPLEADEAADEASLEATKQKKVKESKVKESKGKEINETENKKIDFEIKGLGEMEVYFYSDCEEDWQIKELETFLTKSQGSFEAMAMSNPIMNNLENFNIALQEFINLIQSANDYQESSELRKYFRNWVNKKNGTLEMFLNSFKNNKSGKKLNSSFL